jgi:hypothetical protein
LARDDGPGVNRSLEHLRRQVQGRFTYWSKRMWAQAIWTGAVVVLVIVVEVGIGRSEDALGLNAVLGLGAAFAGLLIWGVGCLLIWLVALCAERFQRVKSG